MTMNDEACPPLVLALLAEKHAADLARRQAEEQAAAETAARRADIAEHNSGYVSLWVIWSFVHEQSKLSFGEACQITKKALKGGGCNIYSKWIAEAEDQPPYHYINPQDVRYKPIPNGPVLFTNRTNEEDHKSYGYVTSPCPDERFNTPDAVAGLERHASILAITKDDARRVFGFTEEVQQPTAVSVSTVPDHPEEAHEMVTAPSASAPAGADPEPVAAAPAPAATESVVPPVGAAVRLLPFMTLQEGADWLQRRGIQESPKGLVALGAEGRIHLFTSTPEGAHRGVLKKPPPGLQVAMLPRYIGEGPPPALGKAVAVIGSGVPFDDLEMLEIPPDRCMQFLQSGEAHIRDAEAPDRAVIDQLGMPEIQDLAKVMVIRNIAAFRVRDTDLEALAAAQSPAVPPAQPGTPSHSASAPASTPEPVAGTAGADKEDPIDRARRLADRVEHWKRKGVHNYTARVADEEGLSVERVRQLLRKLDPKPAASPKKNKPRQKATFCSGLIPPTSRTR